MMIKRRLYCRRQPGCRVALTVCLLMLLIVPATTGWTQTNAVAPIEKSVKLGGSELLDFEGIERTAVTDPLVIDYVVLSTRQVMLIAKKAGDANLYVWDKKGQHAFHILVTSPPLPIPEDQQTRIAQAIANPAIHVKECNDVIILDGEVDTATEVLLAGAIAKAYAPKVENLIRVRAVEKKPALDLEGLRRSVGADIKISTPAEGVLLLEGKATTEQKSRLHQIIQAMGTKIAVVDMVTPTTPPRQIMVRVKVVEVNKSSLSELGIEWGGLNATGAHDQPILFGEASTGPFKLDEVGPFRRLEGLSARLKALVTTNRARILAEPNLLVVEQQKAEILVGGEIPIPVVQNGDNKNGAVSVEWKEFGVKLAMTASIGADGESINLDVMPEVSNLDFGNAVVVSNILLPALQTRRVHSLLHVKDRQTLVIGGLYQVERSSTTRKVPLLGDIPLLGNLFKRTDKKQRETELLIFVTPEIVTDASIAAQTQNALNQVGGTTNANPNKPR